MSEANDRLVEEYLQQVDHAAADLPPQRRDELVADLREHIDTARGGLSPETEAGVRTILDRLGEPADIAAEARRGEPPADGSDHPAPAPRRSRNGLWIAIGITIAVISLLCACGGVVGGLFYVRTPSHEQGPAVPAPAPTHAPATPRSPA